MSDDIWQNDLLDRKADARFLIDFLQGRIGEKASHNINGSYVINLDAGWGAGKTFFLSCMHEQLKRENFVSVYVNAWLDDHAADPMLSVMAAVDDAIEPLLNRRPALKKLWDSAKRSGVKVAMAAAQHGLKTAGKKLIGDGIEEIKEIIDDKDVSRDALQADGAAEILRDGLEGGVEALLDNAAEVALAKFRKDRNSVKNFKSNLTQLIAGLRSKKIKHTPVFILIDELDRCRPSYAIALLERIKHLYDVNGVAFVVATDSRQLRHSIKAIYGATFDSAAYLRRFFNRSYQFEAPSLEAFAKKLLSELEIDESKFWIPREENTLSVVLGAAVYFDLSLRDVAQYLDIVQTVSTVWKRQDKIDFIYISWLAIAFQQNNDVLWDVLVNRRYKDIKEAATSTEKSWPMTLIVPISSEGARRERVDCTDYIIELLKQLSRRMIDIGRDETPSGIAGVIHELFLRELRFGSDRGYSVSSPPESVLRSYPELIRNAGRLGISEHRG